MRILPLTLLVVPFLIACGGPSDSTKITELSDDEAKDLCEELSFSREVNCDGITITLRSANCDTLGEPSDTCTATVGDARACNDEQQNATDAEVCSGDFGTACAKLVGCGSGDDDAPQ